MTKQNDLVFSSLATGYLLGRALEWCDILIMQTDGEIHPDQIGNSAVVLMELLESLKAIVDLSCEVESP